MSTGITKDINVLLPYGVDSDDLDYRYNEESTNIVKILVSKMLNSPCFTKC